MHKQYLHREYNVQLHGCFLCFSEEYFKHFDGFYPETFLYMEEDILFYLTQQKKLTTVYLPELKVFHKEDSSGKCGAGGHLTNDNTGRRRTSDEKTANFSGDRALDGELFRLARLAGERCFSAG